MNDPILKRNKRKGVEHSKFCKKSCSTLCLVPWCTTMCIKRQTSANVFPVIKENEKHQRFLRKQMKIH